MRAHLSSHLLGWHVKYYMSSVHISSMHTRLCTQRHIASIEQSFLPPTPHISGLLQAFALILNTQGTTMLNTSLSTHDECHSCRALGTRQPTSSADLARHNVCPTRCQELDESRTNADPERSKSAGQHTPKMHTSSSQWSSHAALHAAMRLHTHTRDEHTAAIPCLMTGLPLPT